MPLLVCLERSRWPVQGADDKTVWYTHKRPRTDFIRIREPLFAPATILPMSQLLNNGYPKVDLSLASARAVLKSSLQLLPVGEKHGMKLARLGHANRDTR